MKYKNLKLRMTSELIILLKNVLPVIIRGNVLPVWKNSLKGLGIHPIFAGDGQMMRVIIELPVNKSRDFLFYAKR